MRILCRPFVCMIHQIQQEPGLQKHIRKNVSSVRSMSSFLNLSFGEKHDVQTNKFNIILIRSRIFDLSDGNWPITARTN